MAHAIGAIGTSMDLRSKVRSPMTREQRERNRKLVPRIRNQTRAVAFVEISREGEKPKVKVIRAGQLHHYQAAYMFASVDYVRDAGGKPITLPRGRVRK